MWLCGCVIGIWINWDSTSMWNLLTNLNFTINVKMSILNPQTEVQFLGFILRSTSVSLSLPAKKLVAMKAVTKNLLQ